MTQLQRVRTAAPPVSDAALMQRAAQGDVEAFAHIYDRHASIVLALLRRIWSTTSGEEDLLQDVFLEAWLCACDYDPDRASVRAWLLVRARSRALDRRRRWLREKDVRREFAGAGAAGAGEVLPRTERQIAVREGLSTLPASVRATLELTFFDGMTAAEVAATMSVPEGTVKSRLARGLDLMEGVLCGLAEEHDDECR